MAAVDDGATGTAPSGASPSPPTDRVIGVLELLASRPAHPFSLSDITRALGMSKATCHAVTSSLAGADYLIRNPADKTFTLGPAVVAAGRAAEQAYPAVHLAQAEVVTIAEELGLPTTAAIRSEEHLVIVAHAGTGPDAGAVRIGRRIPLAPPFGGVFVAWADEAVIEDWAARTDRLAPREPLLDSLAAIRARGYSVERLTPAGVRLRHALADLSDDPLAEGLQPMVMALLAELRQAEYLPGDLDGNGRHPVSAMSAPVFDAEGRTQMNLSVQPHREMTAREIDRAGRRLLKACARILQAIGGKPPTHRP
ncbi:helix-turn-helix domain-containing protein [Streptomyces sp. SID3343]|uniref:IclR family transcriptional regulator n=1 Tax=Streptomyces sp. SID3343 TaxID=2690260 RepID=UPI00136C45D4|nr:helix-turn-helix domain-containing protein [Streptomyces sp. SID3343]MYW00540.1 helix-turn-helix domain-containing protein [Streptomyces sp. SID3343]